MTKRVLLIILKIFVSGLLIAYLLSRLGLSKIIDHVKGVDPLWLVAALILFSLSHLIGSIQWNLLLRSEQIKIPWFKSLGFYYVGLFFNNFLISNLGGDLFRMIDIKRYSNNGAGAVSSVFLDRFMGLSMMSGLSIGSAVLLFLLGRLPGNTIAPLILLTTGWILILMLLFSRKMASPFVWLIKKWLPQGIIVKVKEVYQSIVQVRLKKTLLIRIMGLSLLVQSARIMTHYLVARSFGIDLNPLIFFLVIPLIAVMASLPISLGGLGLREQTGVLLFTIFGMAALDAFSIEFIAYFIAIASSLPGGLIFVFRKSVKARPPEPLYEMN